MTMTGRFYGGFFLSLANKQVNFVTPDGFKVMLLGSGYTPSDSHRYQTDLGANEITGTGYTSGGAALSSVTFTSTGGTVEFNAATLSWLTSTITGAWYAVIVDSTPGTAATNPLVGYVSFGQAESDTGGTFQIIWNAGGIFAITY